MKPLKLKFDFDSRQLNINSLEGIKENYLNVFIDSPLNYDVLGGCLTVEQAKTLVERINVFISENEPT